MRAVIYCTNAHERVLAEMLAGMLQGGPALPRTAPSVRGGSKLRRYTLPFYVALRDPCRLVRAVSPVNYLIAFAACFYRYIKAHRMISRSKPDVIVLFEDNIGNLTRFIGAAAARRKIPYIVLPTTIPNPREAATFFQASRSHAARGVVARFIARRWPKWGYDFDGRFMLRLPPADIIAMHLLGVDDALPWILNSGHSIVIAAESNANRAIYERAGVESHQISVIGSLVDDVLFTVNNNRAERRETLARTLGVDPDRMWMVVAFPPDQYGAPSRLGFEYASFADLIEGWLQALAPLAASVNIVLRAHPRLDAAALRAFEKAGCHIFTGPTEELVPLADIFVASISATIRWGLALGIPVVNYDCYRYRYGDYDDAPGILRVADQVAFGQAIWRICTEPAFRRELRQRQQLDRGRWGTIDGQFAARFQDLLASMSRSPEKAISVIAA